METDLYFRVHIATYHGDDGAPGVWGHAFIELKSSTGSVFYELRENEDFSGTKNHQHFGMLFSQDEPPPSATEADGRIVKGSLAEMLAGTIEGTHITTRASRSASPSGRA